MNCVIDRSRSGTILICVLACLIVVTAVIGSTTQAALRARSAARMQKQLRQTELLLEAGVLRAAQQLKQSARYEGEQWRPNVLAASQGESDQAVVAIRVSRTDDSSMRAVEVIARLDSRLSGTGPLQRSYQFTFPIPSTDSSENQ